nr:hypothetical chloroplast RF20 [Caulerpa lentillifera]
MMVFLVQLKKMVNLKKRKFIFSFFQSSCSFYFGLICGNLFGTFLVFLRTPLGNWDGLILLFLILFFEFLNIQTIKKSGAPAKRMAKHTAWSSNKKSKFSKFSIRRARASIIIQNIQLGLLLGFFIDAFKVGS